MLDPDIQACPVSLWHGCYEESWVGQLTESSFAHPAKMRIGLLRRIIHAYLGVWSSCLRDVIFFALAVEGWWRWGCKTRILYHVTTEKKARLYRQSGCIRAPVRGFTTLPAALAWATKTGWRVIYAVRVPEPHCYLLPDHHNQWGKAYWSDRDADEFTCVFSPKRT